MQAQRKPEGKGKERLVPSAGGCVFVTPVEWTIRIRLYIVKIILRVPETPTRLTSASKCTRQHAAGQTSAIPSGPRSELEYLAKE